MRLGQHSVLGAQASVLGDWLGAAHAGRHVAEVEPQLLEEDEREHCVRRETDAGRHEALEEGGRARLHDLDAHREQTLQEEHINRSCRVSRIARLQSRGSLRPLSDRADTLREYDQNTVPKFKGPQ